MPQQVTYFLKINDLTLGGKLILLREKVTLSQLPCAELKCLFSVKSNYSLMLLVILTYDLIHCLKHSYDTLQNNHLNNAIITFAKLSTKFPFPFLSLPFLQCSPFPLWQVIKMSTVGQLSFLDLNR